MAESPKCLAQYDGSNGVAYDLYTVPALTKTIVTFLSVCPRLINGLTTSQQTTFNMSYAIAGAVDASKQYICREVPVFYGNVFIVELKITMAPTDVLRVYTPAGVYCGFNLFGVEVT
jgi:hypothetical protein